MAAVDDRVITRSREAVRVLASLAPVRGAWLFGSQAEGRPGPWSDIDIAAFMEGVETWDIRQRARAMVLVQKRVGTDVEVHLFPASAADNPPAGSFAAHVLRYGVRLEALKAPE